MGLSKLTGGCHCGNIQIELELTRAPETYNPRACDCDFCTKHSAAYVSDPKGSLAIRIKDESKVGKYRQGNAIAEFLICTSCGVLVGVTYKSERQVYGAANAKAIQGGKGFGPEQPVSPKKLSGDEKMSRWQDVWFPDVIVTTLNQER
jgi:hypothetical protein